MDSDEESPTIPKPPFSKKSNPKNAESESPNGVVPPEQSPNKSKPDRSNGDMPPSKIQKQDPTCPVTVKEPESPSEEVLTSESPFTEDDTGMEIDDHSPLPSDPKDTDSSVESSENLKVQDSAYSGSRSTSSESGKIQDPVAMDETEKPPRSPSPAMDVSYQSETSEVTLQTTESIVVDADKTLRPSSLTAEVLSKQETSEKNLKKQDVMEENDSQPSHFQSNSRNPEISPKSLTTTTTLASRDLSPSHQSDVPREQKHNDFKIKKSSLSDLNQGLSCEIIQTKKDNDQKLTAATSNQPEISSEPGPSGGVKPKIFSQSSFESGIKNEPGPSGGARPKIFSQSGFESGIKHEPGPSGGARPKIFSQSGFEPGIKNEPEPSGGARPKTSSGSGYERGVLNEPGPSGGARPKTSRRSGFESGLLNEPGPSGGARPRNFSNNGFESGLLNEPGPSGERLRTVDLTASEGEKVFGPESFDLGRGRIGDQFLDQGTCEDIQAELDSRITSNQIVSTYHRLKDSYARQRRQQEENCRRREESGQYDVEELETFEDKEDTEIINWLRHSLPREADYLNSIAGAGPEDSIPDPPSLEDDRSHSVPSDPLPEEDRAMWQRGLAIGERILRICLYIYIITQKGRRFFRPNHNYDMDFCLATDLRRLLDELARRINGEYSDPLASGPLEEFVDSGNMSPRSQSLRDVPSIQDDTSQGAPSLRSDEEPLLGAVAAPFGSPKPRQDQVSRFLSQVSLESNDSSDTSSLRGLSSILDCSSIQDECDSASLSMAENLREKDEKISGDLAEVYLGNKGSNSASIPSAENHVENQVAGVLVGDNLDNDESESACSLEVHLDETESHSDLAEGSLENDNSESTAYPTSSETSSDRNCAYKPQKKDEDDSRGGTWC